MERLTSLDTRSVSAGKACQKIFMLPGYEDGKRLYSWQKSCGSLLASSVEGMDKVSILNRQGCFQYQIPVRGNCTHMAWDECGDVLAVVSEEGGVILFWDCHTQNLMEIDSKMKDTCSCISWSKIGKVFAYCTSKGNLLIYNYKTISKVPILGKHNKGIICCNWSGSKYLVLGTANNQLSINTVDGDAVRTIQLSGKLRELKFGHLRDEDGISTGIDNTTSVIVGDHTLYLLGLTKDSIPIELDFDPKYGSLVTHNWHGDGYIWASFSYGVVTMVSTHAKEMGAQLLMFELESQALMWTALSYCTSQMCICSGEKFVELRNLKNPYTITAVAEIEIDERLDSPISCEFSDDGQLLAVLGSEGGLTVFLTSVPLLGSSSDRSCCHMISLTEFILYGLVTESQKLEFVYSLDTGSEPSLIAMGPNHVAVVFSSQVHFYSSYETLTSSETPSGKKMPVTIKQYNSNILAICLNSEYAATLSGHQVILHPIEEESNDASQTQVIQEYEYENQGCRILCICMTKDFVGYGTTTGIVKLYHITTGEIVNKVCVNAEIEPNIKSIHPDLTGCKYVITDREGCGYLFDLRDKSCIQITEFPPRVDIVLWDRDDASSDIFLTHTRGTPTVDVFVVEKNIMVGQTVLHVEKVRTFLTKDNLPLIFLDGIIYGQSSAGKLGTSVNLYRDRPDFSKSSNRLGDNLIWLMRLHKFEEALHLCKISHVGEDQWKELGKACALNFNLEIAVKAYILGGEFGRAYNLAELKDENDVKLLAGHIALNLGDHDLAEKCYLNSSEPFCAIDMRCDLRQWDEALSLAHNYNPEMCPNICLHYAEDEEESNNCLHALALYEQAREISLAFGDEESAEIADCGIARNALRSGHTQRGLDIVSKSKTLSLRLACAEILENTKFFFEAAELYEQAEEYERAALLFIRNRQWDNVATLLPKVTSKRIHLQYAKMKESEGNFAEAARVYKKASDLLNACRLFLKAGEIQKAMDIAKAQHHPDVAIMIANHYIEKNDFTSAITFLLLFEYAQEAKKLAFKNEKHELFAQLVSEYVEKDAPDGIMSLELIDCVTQVGTYFESLKDYYRAGKYYFLAGESEKAYFILKRAAMKGLVANEDEFTSLLIQVVIDLRMFHNSTEPCQELIDYLVGERDGYPKDLKYLLQFYSLSKNEAEATKTCLVYSEEELSYGNVDNVQRAFVNTCKNLRTPDYRRIPPAIYKGIQMVHFLRLAKLHSELGNVEMAARLFKRVLEYFEDFPKQAIGILTSTVIECYKSELQATALEACFIVMKPEFRSQLAPEFIDKFTFMLRKYGKGDTKDIDDLLSACPHCNVDMPNYDLYCDECRTEIPFCIISGRHLVVGDFAYCPHCEFPGIKTEFLNLIQLMTDAKQETKCPMCEMPLLMDDLENEYSIDDYLENKWIGIGASPVKPESVTDDVNGSQDAALSD